MKINVMFQSNKVIFVLVHN